ncbi:TetR/AcrR family transcriptional regulator [Kiloniella sp.]|uniref:TetR/AcrR family transcriptional regulator n=1 Tax=Kiloniella sp. TaxID=1938587 RepID=UPI003B01EFDC
MNKKTTREHIVKAADLLFYQQGFEHTSFSDIADAVKISRGNFYYHFKTKDKILDAVIILRLTNTKNMLDHWEIEGKHPEDRIRSFIQILITNQSKILRYGCPVGTLSTELSKLDHPAQDQANRLFALFRTWLSRQFTLLGRPTDADDLAMQLLARSQGVATLANAFRDEGFINKEVTQMNDWLRSCVESVPTKPQDELGVR